MLNHQHNRGIACEWWQCGGLSLIIGGEKVIWTIPEYNLENSFVFRFFMNERCPVSCWLSDILLWPKVLNIYTHILDMGKCSSQPAYVFFIAHKLSFIAFVPTLVFTLIEFFLWGLLLLLLFCYQTDLVIPKLMTIISDAHITTSIISALMAEPRKTWNAGAGAKAMPSLPHIT